MKKLFIIIFVLGLVGCTVEDHNQDRNPNLPVPKSTQIEIEQQEAKKVQQEELEKLQNELERKLILIEGYEKLNKELREENDKLIEEYEKTFKEREDAIAELDKLKKENEELQKELKLLKNQPKEESKPIEKVEPKGSTSVEAEFNM